jgi:Cu(I)/Ag(I) efflux system protein CusF
MENHMAQAMQYRDILKRHFTHSIALYALALTAASPLSALAQSSSPEHAGHDSSSPAPSNANAMSDGEVRKIDREAKKITLRHGPIPNIGMPPMTMVFQVDDSTMLDQIKVGDKVKFKAEKSGGAYVVRTLMPAQ